jgi:SAM-dependent methyltransferase
LITLSTLSFLASPSGEQLLATLAYEDLSDANTLRLLTVLRKDYSPENAGAALELARLRKKAVEKFGDDAQRMFFTREALEQASDPWVRYHRCRSTYFDGKRVVDVCCGIGSDSLAFARSGADVLGIDIDPVRVEMARLNASSLSISNARFEVADAHDPLLEADYIFFDPARRDSEGNRIFDVEQYQPPLSLVKHWNTPYIEVKLSPGVAIEQLGDFTGWLHFVSVEGDLKEAQLHLSRKDAEKLFEKSTAVGEGLRPSPTKNISFQMASELSGEHPYLGLAAIIIYGKLMWVYRKQTGSSVISLSEPLEWLFEPDPAIIRAGLVAETALNFYKGFLLDETIAYFTAASYDPSLPDHLARAWRILDWMPFNVKKLRAYLRERNVGNVTVKKRGTAVTPEVLIPQLKLKGEESRTLVLTRCRGEQIVIICQNFGKE